jgi:3-hydroxyisobutyrate dehydrogenase-like beta-hydroxyacid dehydrogenase
LPRIALLGLGEAGSVIAADLVAAGFTTHGWDPVPSRRVTGVGRAASAIEAAAGADVILSVNSQRAALAAAEAVAPALTARHLFADLNTTSRGVKREVAAVIEPTGALFADVALLAPVPGNGIRTPALASGSGAERFVEIFAKAGMPVTVLAGGEAGDAAARKLFRSVFMKGLAAAVIESLSAAEMAGCEPWLREEIVRTFENADEDLLDRLVDGSEAHARRRVDEMEAAAQLLVELGQPPHVAAAAAAVLRDLADSPPVIEP